MGAYFIHLDLVTGIEVILLGFIGGTLSGFIGSGGAFFMTPGMMNLGVSGAVAVGTNITHKFGKAMMGARKHSELGHVDRKLGAYLILTSYVGIWIANTVIHSLFHTEGGGHGESSGSAAADLYINTVFVVLLSIVSISVLCDTLASLRAAKTGRAGCGGPSRRITDFLSRWQLPPMIRFPVADVRVSLWLILAVGLAVGYMAGTIGVGGFLGVPAMIYVFGVPTAVAAGTELYLAMFMGAWGAVLNAFRGYVDIRLTLLLYLGSLVGIYIGAYGTKVVKEEMIRLVTSAIILLCVFSRLIAIPICLRQLNWLALDPGYDVYFNNSSKALLYVSGVGGCGIILYHVFRAYWQRYHVQARLMFRKLPSASSGQ
jgi:uncharacterized membrane protein YfcA